MAKDKTTRDAGRAAPRKAGEEGNGSAASSISTAGARGARTRAGAPLQRRRTQEERRSESEERLLSAALDLLSRKGWVGMTLAEVGEVAGYSRGQATHQFGSKAALLRALVGRMYQSFAERMQAAPLSMAGLEAILGYVRVYFGGRVDDPDWVNARANLLMLAETLLENSETLDIVQENTRPILAWLEDNVRTGMAKGEIRPDVDPVLGAEFVMGLTRGMAMQHLALGQMTQLRKNREQIVRMVEHALAVPGLRAESRRK